MKCFTNLLSALLTGENIIQCKHCFVIFGDGTGVYLLNYRDLEVLHEREELLEAPVIFHSQNVLMKS